MSMVGTKMMTGFVAGIVMLAGSGHAEEPLIPRGMVYIAHGPSVMGIDKDESPDSAKRLTAYEKRMRTPWSAEALNDEVPAHTVFLDSYLMDKYEVSNKQYGEFVKAKGHPAPAYWDDPRLNKPEHPVVGVNWEDAKAFRRDPRPAANDPFFADR